MSSFIPHTAVVSETPPKRKQPEDDNDEEERKRLEEKRARIRARRAAFPRADEAGVIVGFSDLFMEFLKNPQAFASSEENIEDAIQSGKYYRLEHPVDFQVVFLKDGVEIAWVVVEAYFDGGLFVIYQFGLDHTVPKRKGYGGRAYKAIETELDKLGISLDVADIIDESKKFWNKVMR
jgi:hypothetical protein